MLPPSYELTWKRSALKELKRLPKVVRRRVLKTVERLQVTPLPQGARKLSGSERTFRVRVGDYRVVYGLYTEELTIEVIRVGHRKDVYR